jgi:hypothetical protein
VDFKLHILDGGYRKLPVVLALAFVSMLSLAKIGGAVYDYEIAMIDLHTPVPPGPPHLPSPYRREPRVRTADPHQDYGNCYDVNDPCRARQTNFI